jgi:hypothetical protein
LHHATARHGIFINFEFIFYYNFGSYYAKTIIFASNVYNFQMKNNAVILCLVALSTVFGCSQISDGTFSTAAAGIQFESTEHDFGTIPYKGDGTFEFVFKNTGKEPLVLKNVRSSCGCTVPEWPKDPIKKGNKGKIKVSYNTRITGTFSKSISVFSNADEKPVILVIKGKVEEDDKDMSGVPALE